MASAARASAVPTSAALPAVLALKFPHALGLAIFRTNVGKASRALAIVVLRSSSRRLLRLPRCALYVALEKIVPSGITCSLLSFSSTCEEYDIVGKLRNLKKITFPLLLSAWPEQCSS